MPFLQAGFNGRHFDTGIRGWTRHVRGNAGGFAPAKLIQFAHRGDYAWHGKRFLAWGEQVVLGSWPIELAWEHQHGLASCDLDTREEHLDQWGER